MKYAITRFALYTFLIVALAGSALAQTLPKGEWHLVSYNFKQKIAFPIDVNEITLNIRPDGKLGGKSGCNVYGGSYALEKGKLRIYDLISTMMACEEPSMKFEQMFSRTLQGATKFTLSGDKFTIIDPATGNLLRFRRVVNNRRPDTK